MFFVGHDMAKGFAETCGVIMGTRDWGDLEKEWIALDRDC